MTAKRRQSSVWPRTSPPAETNSVYNDVLYCCIVFAVTQMHYESINVSTTQCTLLCRPPYRKPHYGWHTVCFPVCRVPATNSRGTKALSNLSFYVIAHRYKTTWELKADNQVNVTLTSPPAEQIQFTAIKRRKCKFTTCARRRTASGCRHLLSHRALDHILFQ